MDDIDKISAATSEHTQSISASTEEIAASRSLAQMAADLQEATSHFKL